MGIGSNYIRGCFFNKSGTCSLLPCAGSTACSWVVVFPLAWSSVHMFLLLCAHQSLWELVHSREGGRVLERILTLVFRCTGVSFTGTGMGESIYSSVDSCNSTHTRVSQELLGGVMQKMCGRFRLSLCSPNTMEAGSYRGLAWLPES